MIALWKEFYAGRMMRSLFTCMTYETNIKQIKIKFNELDHRQIDVTHLRFNNNTVSLRFTRLNAFGHLEDLDIRVIRNVIKMWRKENLPCYRNLQHSEHSDIC